MKFRRYSQLTLILIALLFCVGGRAHAAIDLCFTPGDNCTQKIVSRLDSAKRELFIQAYSFTSPPIIAAIAKAKTRGVAVSVILDKSNETGRYSGATYLLNHGIAPLVDRKVAIAHNKVIIIDGNTVITGSFNFTKAAQERNAENLIIIDDPMIAEAYRNNWLDRARVATPFMSKNRSMPGGPPEE